MLPSHYCVSAIIEGVFLPRNSIPRVGILSRQKWERISSNTKGLSNCYAVSRAYGCTHTVTPVKLAPDLGSQGHLRS